MPEKAVPLTIALTLWLYQPFESPERDSPTEMLGVDFSR
jgi:hypothetical protein